jgi:hypothetical protein
MRFVPEQHAPRPAKIFTVKKYAVRKVFGARQHHTAIADKAKALG